jgi:hypothetical protein
VRAGGARHKAELVIVTAGWRAGQKAIEVGRNRGRAKRDTESPFTLTEMFGDKARGKRLRALGKVETEADLDELVQAVHDDGKEATRGRFGLSTPSRCGRTFQIAFC